jgi:integrase
MPTIRERTKLNGKRAFHVMVRRVGFPTRTASFPTRKQAEKWATTVEAEMIEGRHFRSADARRRTVADAIDRYTLEEMPRKRNGQMHKVCLPWWKEKIGTLKLGDVTPAVLVEQRAKLQRETFRRADPKAKRTQLKAGEEPRVYTRSASTANRYLSCLAHVFTVARKEWHWLSNNPFDGVRKLRENTGRTRFLSDDERGRLLAETAKDGTLHTLVTLALATAARAGELVRLHWSDVDLKEGRLLFRVTKNAQPRTAWVHGDALALLKEYGKVRQLHRPEVFPGKGRGEYDYAKPFAAAVAAAGIADFRFHDLRHSAATYLAMLGATEQQLRAIGGWKSGIVSRYVHIAANDARGAMQALANKLDGRPAKVGEGGRDA